MEENKAKTTSWVVAGVGVAVAALGYSLMPSLWGAGILGFGLAHIVLGLLDTQRPTIRK
ncbi:MAG TPA: hypothetical protein VKY40_02680 [Halanaerobiales bacterium]|nr:hypothetical protein [Halanaerobiales bacterium]